MRKPLKFKLGNPYLSSNDIVYCWPDSTFKYNFLKRVEELKKPLFIKLKAYFETFDLSDKKFYPRLSFMTKEDLISFQIGRNCACLTLKQYLGGMINFHNLDGAYEKMVGFNLASDTLEILDSKFLAPRILKTETKIEIKYPFTKKARETLDTEKYNNWIKGDLFQRIINVSNIGQIEKILLKEDLQLIKLSEGIIEIKDNYCSGKDFKGVNVCRATFPIAKIVDALYYFNSQKLLY